MYQIYLEYFDLVLKCKRQLEMIKKKYELTITHFKIYERCYRKLDGSVHIREYEFKRTDFSKGKYITIYKRPVTTDGVCLPTHIYEEDIDYGYDYTLCRYEEIDKYELIDQLDCMIKELDLILNFSNEHYYRYK